MSLNVSLLLETDKKDGGNRGKREVWTELGGELGLWGVLQKRATTEIDEHQKQGDFTQRGKEKELEEKCIFQVTGEMEAEI